MSAKDPETIRVARAKSPRLYARDFAQNLGLSEAALCAAFVGVCATRISAAPADILPRIATLETVMALTRNESCVLEKVGCYDHFRPGPEAATVGNGTIDLRLFPAHWHHAFAWDEVGPKGPKRSVQVFDAQGEAVHKIHLRDESNHEAWAALVSELALADQTQHFTPAAQETGTAQGWDNGQRPANATPLAPGSVEKLMYRAAATGVPICFTVGNNGCIERHQGPIHRVLEAGPWINVLDPGLELHLRMDHMAEVFRSDATVTAFDAKGGKIVEIGCGAPEAIAQWEALLAELVMPSP